MYLMKTGGWQGGQGYTLWMRSNEGGWVEVVRTSVSGKKAFITTVFSRTKLYDKIEQAEYAKMRDALTHARVALDGLAFRTLAMPQKPKFVPQYNLVPQKLKFIPPHSIQVPYVPLKFVVTKKRDSVTTPPVKLDWFFDVDDW